MSGNPPALPTDTVVPTTTPGVPSDTTSGDFDSEVSIIWQLLDRETVLPNLVEAWPGDNAVSLREKIIPPHDSDAGPMPIGFAYFLSKDIRHLSLAHRSDRLARYVSKKIVSKYPDTWLNIIYSFLILYTNCQRVRTRHRTRLQVIIDNIEGLDVFREPGSEDIHDEDEDEEEVNLVKTEPSSPKTPNHNEEKKDEKMFSHTSVSDLQKSITAMTTLFPEQNRLSGEESEAFSMKLTPIIQQMEALRISPGHRTTVLFSLLTGKARQSASTLPIAELTLNSMVDGLKRIILYDPDIQDRRVTRWTTLTYNQFRAKESTDEEATRKCVDHFSYHQMDLPDHMRSPQLLLSRLREVFRLVPWCETIYQRTSVTETPESFANKLISAAANADMRRKEPDGSNPKALSPYPVGLNPNLPDLPGQNRLAPTDFQIAAFFAKTPPPPRNRRPFRFKRVNWSRRFQRPRHDDSRFPPDGDRGFGHRPKPPFRRNRKVCFGCRKEGHFLRDCPEKNYHKQRLTYLVDIGEAATFLMDHDAEECENQHDQVLHFIDNADSMDVNTEEFDAWICEMLDAYDETSSRTPASEYFFVPMSLPQLEQLLLDVVLHSSVRSVQLLLLDTGAPKTICSVDWLREAQWTPVHVKQLPDHIHPFRFAGHPVKAMYGACLIAKVRDIQGTQHYVRSFTFIIPPTPIPFLVGLQDQRRLGFDICLRSGNDSHLKITTWHATFPLLITSHPWMHFAPCNTDPDPNFNWEPLIREAIDPATTSTPMYTNLVDTPDAHPLPSTESVPDLEPEDAEESIVLSADSEAAERIDHGNDHFFPIAPWKQDGWKSTIAPENIQRLHEGLKHPEKNALLKLLRQQNEHTKLPPELIRAVMEHYCEECEKHPQLPRRPQLAIPPEATPNIAVSLDAMDHTIRSQKVNVLVIIDSGDAMMRLKFLANNSAMTAFHAYFSRWIAYFDAPVFTIVDRGTNLANQLMATELRQINSQLCPIPTEAPWCIGNNERSHRYLHRAINKLTSNSEYDVGFQYEKLLSDVEMAWNFCQHNHNIIPHFYRFGIMPRILGEMDEPHTINQRITLMEIARQSTEHLRANEVIRRALNPSKRVGQALRLFTINQVVWFHRRMHGWRVGTVSRIDRPTIYVSHKGKMYPTHEVRVRPYFGDISLPPPILHDDPDVQEYLEQPPRDDSAAVTETHPSPTLMGSAPISELLNGIFVTNVSEEDNEQSKFDLSIPGSTLHMHLPRNKYGQMDSNMIFLTTSTPIKSLKNLPKEQQEKFRAAQIEEINFLLKRAVVPFPKDQVPTECELQPLKWILTIKKTTHPKVTERYRARLVSASHRSRYRHSVHGNAPTVALSTVRALYAITPTWITQDENDHIQIFTRDVTKAYLQSNPSQRLIFYRPPTQFFEAFPNITDQVWKAKVQIYGDVEAGLYWNRTFVPWLTSTLPDLQQSMYDPSLLYSRTTNMAVLLCTDDTNVVMPSSQLKKEGTITDRFECRERQELPTDFKGIDISRDGDCIKLSQSAYLASKGEENNGPGKITKLDLQRPLTDEEMASHRKVAGQLAWIATGTAPLSSFASSVALQGSFKTVQIMLDTAKALLTAKADDLPSLRYVPLQFESTHIRLYSDGSFQNLPTKHSQIGFVIALADGQDTFNILHWHSSRSPRRPHSTEESELMALDIGFRCLRNYRQVIFQLLKKEVPVVVYIDNHSLWSNLMNETATSLPEIMYRCRDYIHDGMIASVCLISGTDNPADAMTKSKPNQKLRQSLASNSCCTPAKRVFMLQTSPYRHVTYIPTSSVPMPTDPRDPP